MSRSSHRAIRRKPVAALVVALGVLGGGAGGAAAGPYQWRNVEILGGGFVSGIVYHPTEPGLVYARTDVGGAYRFDRGAGRWVALNDDVGRADTGLTGSLSLAVDPKDPNRLYMAGGLYTKDWAGRGAVLRSTDRGATWQKAELPIKIGGNEDGRSTGERLAVDPNKGAVLFLGANDGLLRSDDHGATWTRVAAFPKFAVTLVTFDPVEKLPGGETAIVYAGIARAPGGGMVVSTDGGVTWGLVPDPPVRLIPHHAAVDAKGVLYVAYGNGLGPNGVTTGSVWSFNADSGAWTNITPVKPDGGDSFGYGGLTLDPKHPGVIMVSTLDRWNMGDDIFRSLDGGKSWKALGAKAAHDVGRATWVKRLSDGPMRMGHWLGDVDIDPTNPDEAIYVTGYGLWRTGNLTEADKSGRTSWRFDDEGLEETVPLELISPPKGAPLLSALGDIGGFRHDDLSSVAASRYFEPNAGTNRGLDFAGLAPDIIARTSDRAKTHGFRSTDGGATWKAFAGAPALPGDRESGRIAVSADGARMLWVMRDAPAFVSSDEGRTWRQAQGGPNAAEMELVPASDRADPKRFYLYDRREGRLLASDDGGETFKPADSAPAWGGVIRAVPGRAGEVWLPAPDGLYRSTKSGAGLKAVAKIKEAWHVGFGMAAPGSDHPAVFVHGKLGDIEGFFRSDDAGEHWVQVNDDAHRFGDIRAITGDPRVFGRLYVATGGRGIVYGEPKP